MKKYLPPAVVAIASAITHFIYFGYPAQVVFDETFATNFLGSYGKGAFFFDVHPPLAKLAVYFFGFLTGASYQSNTSAIGDSLPHSLVLLRLVPMICGFLLPIIIYFISRNIGLSRMAAMTAGLLMAFENSLVVQSRFILFDSMLLLFGFLAVLCWQEYRKRESIKNLFLLGSAIFAAVAFSIKWTGLAFPLVIVILELRALFQGQTVSRFWRKTRAAFRSMIRFVAVYACVGAIVYAGVFAVHFAMLPKSGPGDIFMSARFQSENIAAKFIDLNIEMYKANAYQIPPHQYQSSWWSWPVMLRPIFYWQGEDEYIYLLGNPFIYWLGTTAIVFILGYALLKRKMMPAAVFISIGFLVNYVPFIFITRPMFLYHYEAALIFSIMGLAWLIDLVHSDRWKIGVATAILVLCISSFIYFSPLTYGLHLNQAQLQARMWLSSWR